MPAPIKKVAPNGFGIDGLIVDAQAALDALAAAGPVHIHDSLSTFGIVISSTVPQSLGRAKHARGGIRSFAGVK